MPRKHHQPTYRKHKATGQTVVTLNGRDFYLGPYGNEASRAQYDRRIAEWLGNGRTLPAATLTVAELLQRFWDWVETHYRKADGTPTSEVCQFRYTLRPLNHLFGATPAADFGHLKLKAVRSSLRWPFCGRPSKLSDIIFPSATRGCPSNP